jgi:aarF domain-containing kinase
VGMWLRQMPIPTDFVALLDEWAARFFEELDYVHEGNNATKFAAQMKADLPQVFIFSPPFLVFFRGFGKRPGFLP